MTARDPALRLIECAQALVLCSTPRLADPKTPVSTRLLADLQQAYADYITRSRNEDHHA